MKAINTKAPFAGKWSIELERNSVVAFFATTAADGKTYNVEYFNLDAIISVGYRVNSKRGTQFRQWATERMNEYLVKGFTMDDERLKAVRNIGSDYFDEPLERVHSVEFKLFIWTDSWLSNCCIADTKSP